MNANISNKKFLYDSFNDPQIEKPWPYLLGLLCWASRSEAVAVLR